MDDSDEEGNYDDDDEEKEKRTMWFQGRFFPGTSSNHGRSPTSVAGAGGRSGVGVGVGVGGGGVASSWGMLAVQNEVVDECLACAEGGYRESST